jgi:hypothetical protein
MTAFIGVRTILREDYLCKTCGAKRGDYCHSLAHPFKETTPHQNRWDQFADDRGRRFAADISPERLRMMRQRNEFQRPAPEQGDASLLDELTLGPRPFIPRRDDSVDQWLKRKRDIFGKESPPWYLFDYLLDDYRLHADTGTQLEFDVHEADLGG